MTLFIMQNLHESNNASEATYPKSSSKTVYEDNLIATYVPSW